MSEMTKDEVNIGLFDECKRLQAKVEDLRRGLDDMTGMYRVVSESRAATYIKVEELEAKVEELERLLKAASCPNCNSDGVYYDNMGDVHQCPWCYEVAKALQNIEGIKGE